jgi:hypothetical protein
MMSRTIARNHLHRKLRDHPKEGAFFLLFGCIGHCYCNTYHVSNLCLLPGVGNALAPNGSAAEEVL